MDADGKEEVFEKFAPDENMRLYGRGIRRRLAPMLGNDPARILLAFSLIFSLPGSPLIWYGDELGMGDDLSWRNATPCARLSSGTPNRTRTFPAPRRTSSTGRSSPTAARSITTASTSSASGGTPGRCSTGSNASSAPARSAGRSARAGFRLVETDQPETVFAHACTDGDWAILALHNLGAEPRPDVRVTLWDDHYVSAALLLFKERDNLPIENRELRVDLAGYGYSWLRLRRKGICPRRSVDCFAPMVRRCRANRLPPGGGGVKLTG